MKFMVLIIAGKALFTSVQHTQLEAQLLSEDTRGLPVCCWERVGVCWKKKCLGLHLGSGLRVAASHH